MRLVAGLRRTHLHFLLAVLALALAKPDLATNLAGTVLVAAGMLLRIWAAGVLIKGHGLCTSGPYRRLRHPLYLGSAIAAFGLVLMMNRSDWASLLILGAFLGVYAAQALQEERLLAQRYGQAYSEWARHVPLLLPRLRAHPAAEQAPWRWSQFLANREHLHVLVTTFLVALFYLKLFLLER